MSAGGEVPEQSGPGSDDLTALLKRERAEVELEEALEESFPASDPASSNRFD